MDPADLPPSSVPARAIRRRLLERVADADTSHRTIGADEGDWQPFLDGVAIKLLRESAMERYPACFGSRRALRCHRTGVRWMKSASCWREGVIS